MRKFFSKYDYFWEYEYPFGEDFLKGIFGEQYKRKYSLTGDGIFNLIITNDGKIYDISFKKANSLLVNDGKKAFRDAIKDEIVEKICEELTKHKVNYTVNSGKFITFNINENVAKIEIIKKTSMPT